MQLLLRPDALIGERYRLIRPLGVGGMGEVWAARNETTDRGFALKVMRADLAANPALVQRFLREAKAAGRLRHPHVVEVYDVGRLAEEGTAGVPYLVMELLEGAGLDAILRRLGTLPVDFALRLTRDVARGLDFIHQAGVVHRDLKPGNLFVHRDGRGGIVKILDFGISKVAGVDHHATSIGTVLGSPSYMSPEQAVFARDVDCRTDVWSLGVVLYFCLSGKLPFHGDTQNLLMMAITDGQPLPLESVAPHVSSHIRATVMRCLEKDPARRYPKAGDLAEALDTLLNGRAPDLGGLLQHPGPSELGTFATAEQSTLTDGVLPGPPEHERPRTRRAMLYGAAALGAVCCAAFLTFRAPATVAAPRSDHVARGAGAHETVGGPPDPVPSSVMLPPAPSVSAALPSPPPPVATASAAAVAATAARRPPRPPARPSRPPVKPATRTIDKPDF